MPYKDKQKNNEVSRKSAEKLYYTLISVRMRKSEPEANDALDAAIADTGLSRGEYCRLATIEKLIRDGYLSPDHDNTPE